MIELMSADSSATSYTVMLPQVRITTELIRKKSRFLTVLQRADSAEEAQALVDELRKEHHSARHHCSAWAIGPDRRIQRANDDGEPSGTAGTPMLEALVRTEITPGAADLSDVVVVVIRWFGGTLLGAGGLVSAYSDSVVEALHQARQTQALIKRERMLTLQLPAPFADVGRWENELRSMGITVHDTDYASNPQYALLDVAVVDHEPALADLRTRVAELSGGTAQLQESGTQWVDHSRPPLG